MFYFKVGERMKGIILIEIEENGIQEEIIRLSRFILKLYKECNGDAEKARELALKILEGEKNTG